MHITQIGNITVNATVQEVWEAVQDIIYSCTPPHKKVYVINLTWSAMTLIFCEVVMKTAFLHTRSSKIFLIITGFTFVIIITVIIFFYCLQ